MLYLVVVVLCVQSFYTCDVICVFVLILSHFVGFFASLSEVKRHHLTIIIWIWMIENDMKLCLYFVAVLHVWISFHLLCFRCVFFCSFSLCSLSLLTFCWAGFAFFRPQFSVSQLSVSLIHYEQFCGKCIYMSISGPYATFNSLKLKGKYFDWTLF